MLSLFIQNRNASRAACFSVAIVLMFVTLSSAQPAKSDMTAQQLWESMIAAKGGRERLHAVRTFGVRIVYRTKFYEAKSYSFKAIVLPSKLWRRNGASEPFVRIFDAESGRIAYAGRYFKDLHRPWKRQIGKEGEEFNRKSSKQWVDTEICDVVTHFLMETQSYRPQLVAVASTTWRKNPAYFLYVNGCFGSGAYVVDASTRLPLAYDVFPEKRIGAGEKLCTGCRGADEYVFVDGEKLPRTIELGKDDPRALDNYEAVDGIMLPVRVFGEGRARYEMNREYPEDLFSKRPTLGDWGPWERPKGFKD